MPEFEFSKTSPMAPTVLVILGATGDLASRKIVPALFHLCKKGALPPSFAAIGFGRREFGDEDFRAFLREATRPRIQEKDQSFFEHFLRSFAYHQGDLAKAASYDDLGAKLLAVDAQWGFCSNKLFYLAVPPENYEVILRHIASSRLAAACGPENWTRILVEKPFGRDLASAERLDELMGTLFKEPQIYRIDHYLAKEMAQNILVFRFSNGLFEKIWNRDFIERIDIRVWETLGVETRGAFYDGIGALRDVGQNHLLQFLAHIAMDRPAAYAADAVRLKRAEILRSLKIPDTAAIKQKTFRAQYAGYREIEGVAAASETETFFRISAALDSPRWRGVPITLESGKRLGEVRKEIVVTFRHKTPCLCPDRRAHLKNKIVFSFEPAEGITIEFWSKQPGLAFKVERRKLNFLYREAAGRIQYIEEYEKLLLDAILGDQLLFVSTDEVRAMWRYIDPIIEAWAKNDVPLLHYTPDTLEAIDQADGWLAENGGEKRTVGIVGLGKMGMGLALQLLEKGWPVTVYNRSREKCATAETAGARAPETLGEFVRQLPRPRAVWLMVTAGAAVDDLLFGEGKLASLLEAGDIVIDGGNSFFKDSMRRSELLKEQGIKFLDAGVSGGPSGAREGAAVMVGGAREYFEMLEPLFRDISIEGGYAYCGPSGAGHFVKMVHNGIEYGMMQSLAEGFALMNQSPFSLDLAEVARLYNRGSVIESRLVGWLEKAFREYGQELNQVSGSVAHTGEGEWTVKTAKEWKAEVPVIEESFQFRVRSKEKPSFIGKILSALRNQFGGHSIR